MARGSRREVPEDTATGMQVHVPAMFLAAIKKEAKANKLRAGELARAVVHSSMVSTTGDVIARIAREVRRQNLQAELDALAKVAE